MNRLLMTFMLSALTTMVAQAQQHKLWYSQPARHWLEALPVGNSHLGAMVYGKTDTEEIQFNEETFWSGSPHNNNSPEAKAHLQEVRDSIFAGKEEGAHAIIDKYFFKGPHGMRFLPLGSLKLAFGHTDVTDFRRELNLGNALATTSYIYNNVKYERTVFASQADNVIIVRIKADKTAQIWALYKEVQDYYDAGLRVPDDVTILLCDDNWGNVRRLPTAEEQKRKGGWGLYYHVDYVGAPRNSKWINVTPIQNMWEQLQLAYFGGIQKLWILNVGDLKPMEYPIQLFMDMAWDPSKYRVDNLLDHTRAFCAESFGEDQACEAAQLLNLVSKYNGRITSEMLDAKTYTTDEFAQVVAEYQALEARALRQFITLKPECRDAYRQLILFPVQAMGNIYEMYYAQAMNHELAAAGDPDANSWAERCRQAFKRDSLLCLQYNKEIAGGKWDGMMIQKHISYKDWNDWYPADVCPDLVAVDTPVQGPTFTPKDGYISIEAEHTYSRTDATAAKWTVIPFMGRTRSAVALMPYTTGTDGATLTYRFKADGAKTAKIHVVTKSTLDFLDKGGLVYDVTLDGNSPVSINFNANLNEKPENIYSIYYPTIARRVVEKEVELPLSASQDIHTLTLHPQDPGIVFEKIVIDLGGYQPQYLFGRESPKSYK